MLALACRDSKKLNRPRYVLIETCLMSELSVRSSIRSSRRYTGRIDDQARHAERTGKASVARRSLVAQGYAASRGCGAGRCRKVDGQRLGKTRGKRRAGCTTQRTRAGQARWIGRGTTSPTGAGLEAGRHGARVCHRAVDVAAGLAAHRNAIRPAIQRAACLADLAPAGFHPAEAVEACPGA